MRAISDYVAKEFAAFGLPQVIEHVLRDGRQHILFEHGTRIDVGAFASDAEIIAAARKAFNMTDDNIETTAPEAAETIVIAGVSGNVTRYDGPLVRPPTIDKLPAVELTPAVEKPKAEEPKMGGIMAKGYRPGSLKALLDGLHKEGQSLMQDVAEEAMKVQKAYGQLRTARDDLRAHSEAIRSELGQFSNFADE